MENERKEPIFKKVDIPGTLTFVSETHGETCIYRPDTDLVKLAMGCHGAGVPFETIMFDGQVFYVIKESLWSKGHTSVDTEGIFVTFYRNKNAVEQYGVV